MAQAWEGYEDRGVVTVPAVLQMDWRCRDEGVAWLLLNPAADPRRVQIDLHPPRIGARWRSPCRPASSSCWGPWPPAATRPRSASSYEGGALVAAAHPAS